MAEFSIQDWTEDGEEFGVTLMSYDLRDELDFGGSSYNAQDWAAGVIEAKSSGIRYRVDSEFMCFFAYFKTVADAEEAVRLLEEALGGSN